MSFPLGNAESPLAATVAICTYNGANRIGYVLHSLKGQTLDDDRWEVLVVDNASTDETVEICEAWQSKLQVPLRIVQEKEPGLSHARSCAARHAYGKLICFLDDDSPAAPEWAEEAVDAFAKHSKAGILGGKVKAIWESEPTPLALEVADFALAICDLGDEPFKYTGVASGPVGAGMCVRRDVLRRAYADPELSRSVTGRRGASLASGEDTALAIVVGQMGCERWYVPDLVIHHRIPAYRMTFEYLADLYESIGRGQAMTRRLYDWKARNPLLGALIGVKDLGRWLKGRLLGLSGSCQDRELELRRQLHALHQHQLWGRGWQAILGDEFFDG